MEAGDSHIKSFYLEYNSEKCLIMFHLEDDFFESIEIYSKVFPQLKSLIDFLIF